MPELYTAVPYEKPISRYKIQYGQEAMQRWPLVSYWAYTSSGGLREAVDRRHKGLTGNGMLMESAAF